MRSPHVIGAIAVLLLAAFGSPVAEACICGPDCSSAATADAVFEATVIKIESGRRLNASGSYSPLPTRVHLADVRAWRGEAATLVMSGSSSCDYSFEVGTRYVIVASRDPRDGQLWPSKCSMTRPLAGAGQFREYVRSLSAPAQGGHVWGRVARSHVVTLESGTPVTVTEPILGAHVSLKGPINRAVTTARDGWFSVTELPPGDYAIDVALPPDAEALGTIERRTIKLDATYACAALDLWTRATGVVEGSVVDEAGLPVVGVLVYLQPVGYRVFGPHQPNSAMADGELTDANGRYRFTEVPSGRYVTGSSIMVGPTTRQPFAVAYARASSGDTELVVDGPGASVTVEPFVLRRLTPRSVTGHVRWSDGTPAAGVTVGAAAIGERGAIPAVTSTRTSDTGRFTLPLFDDARFEITVTRDRRVIHRSEILAAGDPITISLPVP